MKTLLTMTIFALSVFSTAAYPSTQRFYDPILNGYRLDWCKTWSSNCGKAAADLFCQEKGFKESYAYPKDNNIGDTTMVIGTGQLCTSSYCDSFQYIDCKDPKYNKPMYEGYRLDWCKNFSSDCGSPAANEFCEAHGYAFASGYSIDNHIGVATKVIGNSDELYLDDASMICDASWCDGFDYIFCSDSF